MTETQLMRAVLQTGPGGPDVLHIGDRPRPEPMAGQVLIRVAHAGVNRHDCNQRARGTPPPGATDILGLEAAGTVEAVGAGVDPSWIGREVCALVNGGAYAQYCLAEHELTFERPAGLSLREAALMPEALFTSWFNLIEIARAAPGEWVLIHGGTSGVGSVAIQLLQARGAKVVTTSGSPEKCALCLSLGAEAAVDYTKDDFVERVRTLTAGRGVDVVLDLAGTMYMEKNLHAIAKDGRIVHVSTAGAQSYSVPFPLITQKRARVTGSLLRGLEHDRKVAVAQALRTQVWPLLGNGIRPVIDSEYELADAAKAHARMETGGHAGKILLNVGS